MSEQILIVEPTSRGADYIQDALDRGYEPVLVFPPLPDGDNEFYMNYRRHYLEKYPEKIRMIFLDETLDSLPPDIANMHVKAVLSGADFGTRWADALAEKLNLPGNSPQSSKLRYDKPSMQNRLKERGLPHIKGETVYSAAQALQFFNELSIKKCVLKPPASSGTQNVHICQSEEEVLACFRLINSTGDAYGRTGSGVLIQQYVSGTEYIVNTVSCAGRHRVTDIWVYNKITVGAEGHAYDYAKLIVLPDGVTRELTQYVYNVLDALEFQYGPAHNEVMFTDFGPVLIETGARPMGGSVRKSTCDECMGHHVTDAALDAYINPEQFARQMNNPYRMKKSLLVKMIIAPETQRVESLPILSFLQRMPSVRQGDFLELLLTRHVSKTVDIITTPAVIELIHESEETVWKDYRAIRFLESHCFDLLFSSTGQFPSEWKAERLFPAQTVQNQGKCLQWYCDKARQNAPIPMFSQKEAALPDDFDFSLVSLFNGFSTNCPQDGSCSAVIFAYPSQGDIEEFLYYFCQTIQWVQPGGKFIVLPISYSKSSELRLCLEVMMQLMNIVVELPRYGQPDALAGSRIK